MRQIIWNLLTNAVKFTPIGGEVSVSACAGDGKASIVVTDSGPGISAEFLPHLFGRFRQADASTTRRYGGLGLGLAISKQLVELHGGTIRAENQTDRSGATFSITFPLAAESAVAAAHHPEQSESLPPAVDDDASHLLERLRGLSVLLVDDDPETCAMASRSLAESGVDLRCAYTAEDAFVLLVDKAPDVLISDISMPVTDGYELIRRVRGLGGQYATMPCVALTAMARREDAAKALAAGFNAHLPKPFDPLGLASMLAGWAPDRNAPSAPAHILLAEDNPDIAELLRTTLEECGYSVSSVASVREAATVAERRPVDLLISDLRLSDGTGWDLMSRLRQTTDVLGIAMSGYSDPTYVEESRASGFSDYLVKPVEGQRLLDSVARLLKGR